MSNRNAFFAAVFTRELDRWKKENKSSQEDFAVRIGVEPNMVSRYKKGTAHPKEETLNSICRELGVDKNIFYPQTFEDWFGSSEEFRRRVFADQEARELNALLDAGIDLLFWEFLWRKIPYTKHILPIPNMNKQDDLLFIKKSSDEFYKVFQQDLEFVSQLQEDVIDYISMQMLKSSLRQRLNRVSFENITKDQINFEIDKLFSALALDIIQDIRKEDS